ncbi:HlyD family efflux transporter periplasmic adaptor subunit [Aquabacterium sp. OR-4]|uniref:HlyD family efflux transporter periplasmic adaptor subunit n=1 Tax=Aquabacterium sp. OR-4 TaxID=2978127 RepID=UPI0021B2700E|nr:HlyD family efflux transporter periplasmic adaptor subunit [Aquabacterium sp. OR-4]MDT7834252.1 HlyD family efflux transporter periplasmic adaptor subunit [Aquabacterium sp. OR-4]
MSGSDELTLERSPGALAADLLARSAAAAAAEPAPPGSLPRSGTAAPSPPPGSSSSALRLLQYEAEVRRVQGEQALLMHLVNEARSLVPYGQAIVFRRRGGGRGWRPVAVSGLPSVDANSPLLVALGRGLARQTGSTLQDMKSLDLQSASAWPGLDERSRGTLRGFALPQGLWVPLPDAADRVDAGVLFLREAPFNPGATVLLRRLGQTYAHAWTALSGPRRRTLGQARTPWLVLAALLLLTALGAMPVRLSVMAPVEVVAAEPQVLTAPINGVVRRINVAPSATVAAGEVVVQFDDIQPRNEMLLAQQRLAVAQARDARTAAAAFQNPEAAHELATARAEYELARVNHDYAVEVLARTAVRAPQAGVVIYTDRRDWEGRAVQVGEEIVQVADPQRIALRVEVPTGNSLPLATGGRGDVYLDNVPFGGIPARVRHASYTPRTLPGGDTAYTVMLAAEPGHLPRIGARGTARLYGDEVPLVVQLLRRPLSAVRQFVGV